MRKQLRFVVIMVLFFASGYSQVPIWTRVDPAAIKESDKLDRDTNPKKYDVYSLDINAIKVKLSPAPKRESGTVSNTIVAFPDGNGQLENFRIYQASIMHPALDAKYPDMKSYVGQGVDDASTIIRFSITQHGLHTMTLSAKGTSYTDPYTKDFKTYIAYRKEGLTTSRTFRCDAADTGAHNAFRMQAQGITPPPATDGVLRVYRLAMACTVEYAAFHVNAEGLNSGTLAQKKAAVLAAMVVSMTRINGIYERDFSITMQLIPNNENIIFINSDNFDNDDAGAIINQSQDVIDAVIGFDNYDIGHTVSTGGGGLAQLWSPCSDGKARGITGLTSPVGDPFDVDYVAHEMGHQFGGNHSYNNSCGGNRSESTAWEPGSGSTIMAYAGICDPNVQNNSDAHFHAGSVAEMTFFITTAGNCGQNTTTGNIPPVVDAGRNYTIPASTPFLLTGTASDANNDILTYCWEQMDTEISVQPPQPDSENGPNFRSLPPMNNPSRYMPNLQSVLNNNLTPAWEVISNVARNFNFAFTVRDNNVAGGQLVTDNMTVNVSGTAGPFLVTAPNTNVSWQAGTNQQVTWNVAGTTANGVDTPYVDILLSTNGGFDYPIVLAQKVPNDGSETVTVPNNAGNANRIMVRGHDNIFYDLSNTNFAIAAPPTTMAIAVTGEQNKSACKGNTAVYNFAYDVYGGFSGTPTITISGNPAGSLVAFSPVTGSGPAGIVMTLSNTGNAAPGFYSMTVTATVGSVTKVANVYLDLLNSQFGEVALSSPFDNATAVSANAVFEWAAEGNATQYEIEVATDAAFTNIVTQGTVSGTTFSDQLNDATTYFWRVRPANAGCAGAYGDASRFTTGIVACEDFASANVPVTISAFDPSTVSSTLTVSEAQNIEKITVALDISHTWVSDMTVTLTSPQGTQVILFADKCWESTDVNAVFDDNGSPLSCGNNPALSGLIIPQQALSAFNGQSPQGAWTLTIADNFGADGGALNYWSLNICSTQEATPAGVKETTFDNFSLYPNPNTGNFTVRFNSTSGNDVAIAVYDMRGRQIFNNSYPNTGLIEQNIALGTAEAGVYLVSAQDGTNKITKKIIVK
ncbi:MAG: T9SS type A sorting domain-containing protein [Sphingobacteriales bacterium]|nr:MAG: T9SS type A sorting domain-containing protein [Sphingobacteriales bacterium]